MCKNTEYRLWLDLFQGQHLMALKINDTKNESNENVHLPRARKEKTHCNTTAVWILLTKGTSAGAKQTFMSKPEDG